jgi:hypothetical protein
MADNKQNVGRQDDIRVDINDKSEVEYIHQQFPNKDHQEIVEAIRSAGPMRSDVMDYLRRR